MGLNISAHQLKLELGDPTADLAGRWTRPLLWACMAALLAFVAWATWATVDEVTRGQGRVVPSTQQQSIQSLEGGIVSEIPVTEGQVVEAGQVLVVLDQTRFRSAYLESRSKAQGLRAAIARLEAEVFGAEQIALGEPEMAGWPEMETEQRLFAARRQRQEEATAAIHRELNAARRQAAVVQPLVAKAAVGEMELLRLQREVAGLEGRLAELGNAFVQDAYTELADKRAELAALEQVMVQRNDQLRRTRLVSPVRGVVNNISITTRGGVVPPGEEIMQITPLDDQLLIETRILPQDVAFIAPGMPATVRISAYDYSIYGALEGEVAQISSDTLEEQTPRGEETYYRVLVKTTANYLRRKNEALPIKPGMIAVVDIRTGERNIISYLLRPFTRLELR
ncbi:HlyD family efflux transporter periplasmic adaptor subunit [Parahaliea aestuarii]|uniref:HlyD family efflux transporter periplasmic adaptor subunit n=1 Tax=Parahaliea aestuarii TaxID=1852021 RepID=A0A5C8ZN72_9GAMM|nr:HlyD family efflux transporter periplasmic adaptor subunit [Parahaliea aestuarii]TXS89180.1 HlyD family efflux transporter periplasmic adaptor subunit [Parahaliea aestuarii]